MFWLFALGVITLAVYHKGFRKVLLWTAGIGGFAFALLEALISQGAIH